MTKYVVVKGKAYEVEESKKKKKTKHKPKPKTTFQKAKAKMPHPTKVFSGTGSEVSGLVSGKKKWR